MIKDKHRSIPNLYLFRYIFVLLCCLIASLCYCSAQNIAVSSFKLLETDMDANLQGTRVLDQNGETAALIKIVTTERGFGFSCGALGIVKTVETPAEIWLYIPRGAQKITIKHPQLGVLRDYHFNKTILGGRTYEMVLNTGKVETTVKSARTTQYLVFNLTPKNAIVELNGEMLQTTDGIASKMVKFGIYDYQIKAPNYLPKSGKVEVDDPNNKKVVDVMLDPNFTSVSIITDNDAEIWINGEHKGNDFWTGDLGPGIYEFEAKKENHRSTIVTKEIGVSNNPISFTLDAPIPIYGELNISSIPAGANVYIDGKKVATTPQIIPDILIGSHVLSISKEGYISHKSNIIVKEEDETEISVNLEKINKADYNRSSYASSREPFPQYHKVKKGETVSSIARDYETTIDELCSINKFRKNLKLKPGQVIRVPERKEEMEETVVSSDDDEVHIIVDDMPMFPGGSGALFQYLSNNVKYPTVAEENGVQGRVIATFVVEKNGAITNAKIVKSVDPSLDKELLRVIRGMPHWIPGCYNGKIVRVKYTLPFAFRLQ